MPVDLFAPGVPQALVLLALRLTGLLVVAPVFSAKTVPVRARTALLLVFTLLLAPVAVRSLGARAAAVVVDPATCAAEFVVGFTLGFGAAVLVGAVETAGDLMSTTVGLSGASLLDPLGGGASPVLAQFAQLFAVTVLLALDGHLVMLDAVAESVRALPVGGAVELRAGLAALVASGGALFVLGLRFAAPVIAAAMIGNTALAVLTRVAPAINVLTVAFPLQAALGLTAVVAALAMTATWLVGWSGHYGGALARVFAALVP
ncbi:flagellar biosynthetic protein FliR [Gemmatimonadetes bacterium T265]|nr:flagellar biosynthetic protein FliR [Gemmatimonadetes bacterium T265]